jgi:protein-S-isoprenylcysteine O-methyltransferase Ste14
MLGFLFQWPTILTVAMFPILVVMYARLGKQEEVEMVARFGQPYQDYLNSTPKFIPKF